MQKHSHTVPKAMKTVVSYRAASSTARRLYSPRKAMGMISYKVANLVKTSNIFLRSSLQLICLFLSVNFVDDNVLSQCQKFGNTCDTILNRSITYCWKTDRIRLLSNNSLWGYISMSFMQKQRNIVCLHTNLIIFILNLGKRWIPMRRSIIQSIYNCLTGYQPDMQYRHTQWFLNRTLWLFRTIYNHPQR